MKRAAAVLCLVIAIVACAKKELTRDQANWVISTQLFGDAGAWKDRKLEGVTGVATGPDGKTAVVEFKFTFPRPGREWEEKSFIAKAPLRLYDDGWRVEGSPEVTATASR